jgi:hypothetical protein
MLLNLQVGDLGYIHGVKGTYPRKDPEGISEHTVKHSRLWGIRIFSTLLGTRSTGTMDPNFGSHVDDYHGCVNFSEFLLFSAS